MSIGRPVHRTLGRGFFFSGTPQEKDFALKELSRGHWVSVRECDLRTQDPVDKFQAQQKNPTQPRSRWDIPLSEPEPNTKVYRFHVGFLTSLAGRVADVIDAPFRWLRQEGVKHLGLKNLTAEQKKLVHLGVSALWAAVLHPIGTLLYLPQLFVEFKSLGDRVGAVGLDSVIDACRISSGIPTQKEQIRYRKLGQWLRESGDRIREREANSNPSTADTPPEQPPIIDVEHTVIPDESLPSSEPESERKAGEED
jgi:hypothetical protein